MSTIHVDLTGTIRFIYDDDLRDLLQEGEASVKRVSHVEPIKVLGKLGMRWTADMRPVDGPVLGSFDTRQEALKAEVAWIEHNIL